jgi:hypothetical protein
MPIQGRFTRYEREDMVMAMNPEIKARWTAALRSGEYPQGTNYLRSEDGFCCLGVLCDLAVKDGIITEAGPGFGSVYWEYADSADEALLPWAVQEWAGLHESNPHVDPASLPEGVTWNTDPDEDDGGYMLANMNDGGTPSPVIADIIDQQL